MRRASVALESVCYIGFLIALVGSAFEIVNTIFINDLLGRAAYAVARDNAMRSTAAADDVELEARAWEAIRGEVRDRLNPALVKIDIAVYDNPSAMLLDEESLGENSLLGGDTGDMVVVRLGFESPTPFGWMRRIVDPANPLAGFRALAVARNDRLP